MLGLEDWLGRPSSTVVLPNPSRSTPCVLQLIIQAMLPTSLILKVPWYSSVATTLASRAPIETGGFVQPEEAAASPNFAVNRTASFDNVGNASVNNTNASLTTDTSDTDMVDIGNLTIRQNLWLTMLVPLEISFRPQSPIALAGLAVTPIDLGHHSELVLKRPPIPIAALDRLPRAPSSICPTFSNDPKPYSNY
ncbi:hypothetical protein H4Q26_013048 [Puccinia striiformis f. sp. tritici PST-130]|nr:hypothetical protein H4Q26_013048 [Puccinia striiformis f. sp. tritici PST-130]